MSPPDRSTQEQTGEEASVEGLAQHSTECGELMKGFQQQGILIRVEFRK